MKTRVKFYNVKCDICYARNEAVPQHEIKYHYKEYLIEIHKWTKVNHAEYGLEGGLYSLDICSSCEKKHIHIHTPIKYIESWVDEYSTMICKCCGREHKFTTKNINDMDLLLPETFNMVLDQETKRIFSFCNDTDCYNLHYNIVSPEDKIDVIL
jgi:hypothetical protein